MAARVRRQGGNGLDAWPGYVDALSTLLMVIIFVLLVFVLAQGFLATTLSGRDQALEELRRDLATMRLELMQERQRSATLGSTVTDLDRQLGQAETARRSLSRQLQDLRDLTSQLGADRDRLMLQATDSGLALEAATVAVERLRQSLTQATERIETLTRERDSALAERARATAAATAAEQERDRAVAQGSRATVAATLAEQERDRAQAERARATAAATIAEQDRDRAMGERTLALRAVEQAERDRDAARAAQTVAQEQAASAQRDAAAARTAQAAAQEQATSAQRDLAAARGRIGDLERQIAELDRTVRADRATIEARLSELVELGRQAQALAALRDSLLRQIQEADAKLAAEARRREATETESTDRAAALAAARAELAALRRALEAERKEVEARRAELARVASALDLAERDTRTRDTTIADLEQRLNTALADKVEQLRRYRSEFFGRLREVLESRAGIQVVGDRFVFQSEVLFPVGSSEMTAAGVGQMTTLALSIRQIASEIPSDVPWVLRVDGHTDRTPMRGVTNWELSAARAITVVKFLISLGVPAEHLAAAAFGEFQPLVTGDSPEVMARNRRIELRLTDR